MRSRSPAGVVEPDVAQERRRVEIEPVPLVGDFLREVLDAVVEAGYRDRAVIVVQLAEDLCQHMDRVDREAPVKARVQIPIGARQHDFLADDAAQRDGDRGRRPVPHAGVADERDVGLQLFGVRGEEGRQRRRSGLFLAFEQRGDMAGRAAELPEGAAGLEKGHELALVVAGASRHDLLAVRAGLELRLERRVPPEVQRIDRLHVIMAVEQNVRRLAARGLDAPDNHRAASGRMFGGLEAKAAELPDQPVGGPLAIGKMRWNGGDRRDREKSEQTLERRRLTGVNSGKNVVDRGHPKPLVARCRP